MTLFERAAIDLLRKIDLLEFSKQFIGRLTVRAASDINQPLTQDEQDLLWLLVWSNREDVSQLTETRVYLHSLPAQGTVGEHLVQVAETKLVTRSFRERAASVRNIARAQGVL